MDRFDTAPASLDIPLALPPAPADPARAGFPLIASLAPVAGAIGLWAITGSLFSLMFAALGPLVAIASMVDARRSARRQRRRGADDRRRRLIELSAEIRERHDLERRAAWHRSPSSRRVLEQAEHSAWRDGPPPPIVLGRGAVASSLRVDGAPIDSTDRELLLGAGRLDDAPVLAAAGSGIGFAGELQLARAAARACVVQFAHHAHPRGFTVAGPVQRDGDPWAWLHHLPHAGGRGRAGLVVIDRPAGSPQTDEPESAVVAIARIPSELPPGLGAIVMLEGPDRAILRRQGTAADAPMVPVLVGAAESESWARSAAAAAERAGFGNRSRALPSRVRLDELRSPGGDGADRSTLAAVVGIAADDALELDLARSGPHALVAGTTGSGKSEFLLAWIVALAGAHPPSLVSFLLVDFKGGAAFEPVRRLPHVTGIVTDLDESEAERAVLSLRAELTHRETVLAAAGARDIAALDHRVELPRLVIVIDEFQAMIERFPELGAVVGDIAARGRSLGVHLVLASQRPNGVVREQVTANCAIRVSLRVLQRSDSEAVVGTPEASEIPSSAPGRGVIDRGDGIPVLFQSAIAVRELIDEVTATSGSRRARRTWLDPLPTRIAPDAVAELVTDAEPEAAGQRAGTVNDRPAIGDDALSFDGLSFGVVDEPERQRRSAARWSPLRDGALLVLGAPGSGRSTALTAVENAVENATESAAESLAGGDDVPSTTLRLDGPRSAVWDALAGAQAAVRGGAVVPTLVVIDDLDMRFRAWPEEYRHAASAMVESLIREGRARGLAVAASAVQPTALGAGLRDAFGSRLLLRHATRTDLVQAGGRGELWRGTAPSGSGQWHGHRLQVVDAARRSFGAAPPVLPLELRPDTPYTVVTTAPRAAAATIAAAGRAPILLTAGGEVAVRAALAASSPDAPPPVIVGDGDAWASSWSLSATLREDAVTVVHGSLIEFRSLVRTRELPPLLDDTSQCWVIHPVTGVQRAIWPVAPGG
ncbi:FtsK/SpoIIIE domain-containing protein [Agromyces laixinhei]|uniref:FtsK/SpoIIIE domain-containing protein n=1 Tax=Agromyces laixinhei TaxID=2585717 RepID=UPI0012EDCE28|nr:FtsK/SpoIIIE domain-containing protein [Agromyces laixinhei]